MHEIGYVRRDIGQSLETSVASAPNPLYFLVDLRYGIPLTHTNSNYRAVVSNSEVASPVMASTYLLSEC